LLIQNTLKNILKAKVYDVAKETPLQFAPQLSKRFDVPIFLKREDLQDVFSFKIRGAYNKMSQLSPEEKSKGVIAASAGNHAQGVALSGKKLNIKTVIVMPKTTPTIKVNAVIRLGGQVVLHGEAVHEAFEKAQQLCAEHGYTFVHPFDDDLVIAGQGTVAAELLKQHPEPFEAVFVPVGGGGLLAGVAAYVKCMNPKIKVIGVEPEDAACLAEALKANERVVLSQISLFADGVAVKQIGERPFAHAKEAVDFVITVTNDEICAAIKDIFDETRSIAEPAGALGLAGLKKYASQHHPKLPLATIVSGANMNFDRLRYIAERAEIGEYKEALFAVTLPEKPGSFKQFCKLLGKRSITEFNYRYADATEAHIFVGIELSKGQAEQKELLQLLTENGYKVTDLTQNEMAKLHIRYMVGGKNKGLQNERIFSFEFPEKPGALMTFLNSIGSKWNISLFHYRNHGADFGRVLAGLQIPSNELETFSALLKELDYNYTDETHNEATRLFV